MNCAHSPTFTVTSPTSQLILQPFHRFIYVTVHPPTLPLLHIRHSSFSNPSFASPTSEALHLIHLASRPCVGPTFVSCVIEVCRLGLDPLYDIHLRLSVILKTLRLTGQEFLEV